LAHYAFESGVDEIFAVVRPRNARGAATARRLGSMEWVGETDKYYALRCRSTGCARAVRDLRSDGQDEAFGEAVRPRTPGRDLDNLDTRVRHDRVERRSPRSGKPATWRSCAV
jgi:hypothetical protein